MQGPTGVGLQGSTGQIGPTGQQGPTGPQAPTAGAVSTIDFAIGTAATTTSATLLSTGAIVLRADVTITTPYSPGATIEVGQAGSLNLFQDTPDNVPTVADFYSAPQRTAAVTATSVVATIGGAPAAGAGFVTVQYAVPNP